MSGLRAGFGTVVLIGLVVVLIPVGVVLWLVLGIADILTPRRRPGAPPEPLAGRDVAAGATIMVLTWNGRELLETCLPALRAAVAADGRPHEIVVVDNGSTDDTAAFLARSFPEVRVVRHPRNEKFVAGYNLALAAARRDVLVLLNNDMVVEPGFLAPLLQALAEHPAALAATARIVMADGSETETGRTRGRFSAGMLKLGHAPVADDGAGPWPCLWPGGGCTALDRRAFVAMGGFETLFAPYYYEDTSLGWQAWRRGHLLLLVPAARAVHRHRASSGRLPPAHLLRIQRRNAHLFVWRSFDDPRITAATSLLLPLSTLRFGLQRGFAAAGGRAVAEAAGLLTALPRLPAALHLRCRTRRQAPRSVAAAWRLAHSRALLRRELHGPPPADSPLRLLVLLARLPRRGADGSWVQFELLRALGRRHHVTVFAILEHPRLAAEVEALAPLVARVETMTLEREPARIDLLALDPDGLRRDYGAAKLRDRVAELLASEPFDSVQVDYFEMAYVVEGLVAGLPALHVVHEPLASAAWVGRGIGRWRAVALERRLLRGYRRLIAMSAADAATLRRWHGDLPVTVVHNGIDAAAYRPAPPAHRQVALFVGSYAHPPNVDAALWLADEIWPRVRARMAAAELHLVGGDDAGRLAGLEGRPGIVRRGFVADLEAAVHAAGCFVAPLRAGGGMRSKVVQAFAWGAAVVATPLALAGIAGRDREHFLRAASADDLAAAIVRVLSEAELRLRLGAAARQLVEQEHALEAMAAGYERLHREAIAEVHR